MCRLRRNDNDKVSVTGVIDLSKGEQRNKLDTTTTPGFAVRLALGINKVKSYSTSQSQVHEVRTSSLSQTVNWLPSVEKLNGSTSPTVDCKCHCRLCLGILV